MSWSAQFPLSKYFLLAPACPWYLKILSIHFPPLPVSERQGSITLHQRLDPIPHPRQHNAQHRQAVITHGLSLQEVFDVNRYASGRKTCKNLDEGIGKRLRSLQLRTACRLAQALAVVGHILIQRFAGNLYFFNPGLLVLQGSGLGLAPYQLTDQLRVPV